MRKSLLLFTDWEPDYWNLPKEARYTKTSNIALPEWDELNRNCPLPALGIYTFIKKQDISHYKFVYIKVKGMRYDPVGNAVFFSFEPLKQGEMQSKELMRQLPQSKSKFFSAIDITDLLKILRANGENPPEEWKKLIELKEQAEPTIIWRDYIGKYFLEIETANLSNDEFEDRIARLLIAVGFDVVQKGHLIKGEFPDGVSVLDNDLVIVYDCKNSTGFTYTASDRRAIEKYYEDEKKIRKGEIEIYCAYIAKSFSMITKGKVFHLSVVPLLYLLYKKQRMGKKFNLNPLRKIFSNIIPLEMDTIDNEWID